MTTFHILSVLMVLAGIGGYLNHTLLRLPATIGQMALALLTSIAIIALGRTGWIDLTATAEVVKKIDFANILLHVMLSFLLFAGALHADAIDLRRLHLPIGLLATVGVVIATFVIGTLFWFATAWTGLQIGFIYALLFGALIAPTDPIAVMGILKQVEAPPSIQTKIGGESLFNDGVGVVVFATLLGIANSTAAIDFVEVGIHLLRETGGGVALGLSLGWITYRLLASIDSYKEEVMLTLALATGGYVLAERLHVSAPICIVTAGLVIGTLGRAYGMSDKTRHHVDLFWELLDEILNALLFMLIGLELLVLDIDVAHVTLGALAIAAMLIGRAISVGLPIGFLRLWRQYERGTIRLLTWGGLRGGISIALALSLPPSPERELILSATYIVVLFSVFVQGMTFGALVRLLTRHRSASTTSPPLPTGTD